jgi:hypothetical protein
MMGIFERELQKKKRKKKNVAVGIKERPCNDSSFNQSEEHSTCSSIAKAGAKAFKNSR